MSDLPLAERGRLLSELAAVLATLPHDRPHTWRLGEAMRRMLKADGVAMTVEYLSDSRTTICASSAVAEALESLQEVTGEGPGYEAARRNEIVVARIDGADDPRWPMFARAVDERYGSLTMHAVPLHAHGSITSVATLHTHVHEPLAEELSRVEFLANAVGAALVADAAEESSRLPQLGETWSGRSVVHQATGMVMAQVFVTAEDALALLRGQAYAASTDIGDVAARVVSREINFTSFEVEGD